MCILILSSPGKRTPGVSSTNPSSLWFLPLLSLCSGSPVLSLFVHTQVTLNQGTPVTFGSSSSKTRRHPVSGPPSHSSVRQEVVSNRLGEFHRLNFLYYTHSDTPPTDTPGLLILTHTYTHSPHTHSNTRIHTPIHTLAYVHS